MNIRNLEGKSHNKKEKTLPDIHLVSVQYETEYSLGANYQYKLGNLEYQGYLFF